MKATNGTTGHRQASSGLTLAEVLVSVAIFSLVAASLYQVTAVALASWRTQQRNDRGLTEGRVALEEIVRHVRATNRVLLPLRDGTARPVLAVAERLLDTDQNGILDADNDQDGLINEDWGSDLNGDGKAGIRGIDDDGDGIADNSAPGDDDEDGLVDEDPINGRDDDGDGAVDEDPPGSGINEDGDLQTDEDPVDTVVFYLDTATNQLIERLPDYSTMALHDSIEAPLAADVQTFEVTRATGGNGILVSIRLVLQPAGERALTLQTDVLASRYP